MPAETPEPRAGWLRDALPEAEPFASDAYEALDGRRLVRLVEALHGQQPAMLVVGGPDAAPLPCQARAAGDLLQLGAAASALPPCTEHAALLVRAASGHILLSGPLGDDGGASSRRVFGPVTHALRMQSRASRRVPVPRHGSGVVLRDEQGAALELVDLSEGGAAIVSASAPRALAAGDRLLLTAPGHRLAFRLERIAHDGAVPGKTGFAWRAIEAPTMHALRRLLNELEAHNARNAARDDD